VTANGAVYELYGPFRGGEICYEHVFPHDSHAGDGSLTSEAASSYIPNTPADRATNALAALPSLSPRPPGIGERARCTPTSAGWPCAILDKPSGLSDRSVLFCRRGTQSWRKGPWSISRLAMLREDTLDPMLEMRCPNGDTELEIAPAVDRSSVT